MKNRIRFCYSVDKTTGDFPSVDITPSDLGLAPNLSLFNYDEERGPNRENSSDAAHMFDRSSTYLRHDTWSHLTYVKQLQL
ncbi:MAG: hypothetical protein ACOC49_01750, partial [Candidatus Bipolaricaulota bacterium]